MPGSSTKANKRGLHDNVHHYGNENNADDGNKYNVDDNADNDDDQNDCLKENNANCSTHT